MNAITCFGCETKTGVVRILVIYTWVQPHYLKGLGESFLLMSLSIGLYGEIIKIRFFLVLVSP